MKDMKLMKILAGKGLVLLTIVSSMIMSCTDYDTPPYVEEGVGSNGNKVSSVKNYVLWINLEGAGGGDLVKNALPEGGVIKGMLSKSIYMWSGLEAEHVELDDAISGGSENPIACASLLTGNTPYRHGISDHSYVSEMVFDPDFDEAMKSYSSFFQYIADYDKTMHTLAITPWAEQNKNLLLDATRVITSASDEETLELALKNLKEEDNRMVYLSFKDVLSAAVSGGGWRSGNSAYTAAMQKMDDYVGQLLEEIKKRESAYYEDWLVIVTSNHGGKEDGTYGGNSPEERNMFGIFYFPHFTKPKELTGEAIEVLRYDYAFKGVVIDSVTTQVWADKLGLEAANRQVYSIDTAFVADAGITVQMIMSTRPSVSRSYIPGTQDGVPLIKKGKWSQWLTHTYCASEASFYGFTDGKSGGSSKFGDFVDPTLHSYTMTMRVTGSTDYDDKVTGTEDEWGVMQPDKINKKRIIKGEIRNYFDGIPRTDVLSKEKDEQISWFRDNENLEICDVDNRKRPIRWSCRYIAELRIWNKMLNEIDVKKYSDQLKLTKSNCKDYDNLIGYWQFYKGEEGEYLKDDSLVVNQIKEITKRDGTKISGEPIRLRKRLDNGQYTPVTKEDIRYETIPNSLYQNMVDRKRMMESSTVVPVILNWFGIEYPVEKTRDSGFKLSKLDGVWYPLDASTNKFVWKWMILGDYHTDLEWREIAE